MQDLTPQLRTRLNRLERAVALFVIVATVLMLAGLYFYVRRTAERKGWFVVKLPYFTFVDSAAGLKVGDPVKLMGFDVGEVTLIDAQPPGEFYNVFVAFTIRDQYNGYLWDDSKARVVSKDLLGNRYLEVTKGTNGIPSFYFHPVRTNDVNALRAVASSGQLVLGEEIWDTTRQMLLERADQPLTPALLDRLESNGVHSVLVVDKATRLEWPTHVWNDQVGRYEAFDRRKDKGYYLPPDEEPALQAVAARMLDDVKRALPNVLALTNRLQRLLDESANAAAEADALLTDARPAVRQLETITRNLSDPSGSLGRWLLPPEMNTNLARVLRGADGTLANASLVLTNTDARLAELTASLGKALDELAGITANLRRQVDSNTNIVSHVSRLLVDTDHFVQGLKRHWLLKGAFRELDATRPPAQSAPRRAVSPKSLDR